LASELGMECAEHCNIIASRQQTMNARAALELLEAEARDLVLSHGDPDMTTRVERSASMCFRHQVQTLPIDLPTGDLSDGEMSKLFEAEYLRQFAISSDDEVVIRRLAVRVVAEQGAEQLVTTAEQWHIVEGGPTALDLAGQRGQSVQQFTIRGGPAEQGNQPQFLRGPALIRLPHSTALVPERWEWRMTSNGDVLMRPA
jgi:N-methylhydantoinase A/oxoprolinase/acetone carboxylase beta subunit